GAQWTTNCLVDRTIPNGDLWAESWEDMSLSHFSGTDHSFVASYSFNNATAIPITRPDGSTVFESYQLPTGLAALPRGAGVSPLPADAIGDPAAIGPVAPDLDSSIRSAVIAPMPAIQALNSIVISTSGPSAGQLYIGTSAPPDSGLGRGYGYLLRL